MTTFLGPYHDSVFATSFFNLYNAGKLKAGQSFVAAGDLPVDNVRFYLKKLGAPDGSLQVTIYNDDGTGKPATTGPANNVSSTVAESSVTTTLAEYIFNFATRPELVDGQRYHLVLKSSSTNYSGSIYSIVGVDGSQVFGAGKFHSAPDASTTWTEQAYDAAFKVYFYTDGSAPTLASSIAALGTPPSDCRHLRSWLIQLADTIGAVFPDQLPPENGGTGVGQYTAGDILYATSPRHLERLPIGAAGQTLSVSAGLLPSWSGEGSSRVVANFTNKSGGQLDPGDLVIVDTTNNQAVKTSTVLGDTQLTGVVARLSPNDAQVSVVLFGITQVRVSGAVARGDTLVQSTTAKRGITAIVPFGSITALEAGTDGGLVFCFVNFPAAYDHASTVTTYTPADQPSLGSSDVTIQTINLTAYGNTTCMILFRGRFSVSTGASAATTSVKYRVDGGSLITVWTNVVGGGDTLQATASFAVPLSPGTHTIDIIRSSNKGSNSYSAMNIDVYPLR